MAGDARRLGLYGFGAAAHLIAQVARAEGREVYAFTSPGDVDAQRFALELGAVWAGSSTEPPPAQLDAAILFAPVGALVPQALRAVGKGGIVVCGGIHMSDIPSFPYRLLWEERVRSEEHTSELQSRGHLVCRLLLEKKNHEVRGRTRCRRAAGAGQPARAHQTKRRGLAQTAAHRRHRSLLSAPGRPKRADRRRGGSG